MVTGAAAEGGMDDSTDWISLPKAIESVDRSNIAAWCSDGVLQSRVSTAVTNVFDSDTGINEVLHNHNFPLPPDLWVHHRLGNLEGDHWVSGTFRAEQGVAPLSGGLFVTRFAFYRIELCRDQLDLLASSIPYIHGAMIDQKCKGSIRSPTVKTGRPPSDEQILAKAEEMRSRGMNSYEIAAAMRHEPGFEHAGTVLVRQLVKGRWKPSGRPQKAN
jgi:hypothetical protein